MKPATKTLLARLLRNEIERLRYEVREAEKDLAYEIRCVPRVPPEQRFAANKRIARKRGVVTMYTNRLRAALEAQKDFE